jgi:hypothetical protein
MSNFFCSKLFPSCSSNVRKVRAITKEAEREKENKKSEITYRVLLDP